MSSAEFSDWQHYHNLYPFGTARDNMHAGLIAQQIANSNLNQGQRPYSLDDFMLKSAECKEREATQSLMAFMLQISEGKEHG